MFSAMHYAARFSHLNVLLLFFRAGGDPNVLNEFYHTPLAILGMFVQPVTTRERQLKCTQLLCEKGADVNIVDKGGFTPLTLAALNNDLEVISILLRYGAKVHRPRHTIVLPHRQLATSVSSDPACKALLHAALQHELNEAREKEEIKQNAAEACAAKVVLHKQVHKKMVLRQEKLKRAKAVRDRADKGPLEQTRKERVEAELVAGTNTAEHVRGEWIQAETGSWEFTVDRSRFPSLPQTIERSACRMMEEIQRARRSYDRPCVLCLSGGQVRSSQRSLAKIDRARVRGTRVRNFNGQALRTTWWERPRCLHNAESRR
jgi:hypothetical protein